MKRVVLSLFLLAALFVLAILFILNSTIKSSQPSYRKENGIVRIQPYKGLHYEFLDDRPFAGDKVWIETQKPNSCYLFDIERQTVLGELTNGWPVFMNSNQTKLLCVVGQRTLNKSPFNAFRNFVTEATGGRIDMGRTRANKEVFWILDLDRNKATKLGSVYQDLGTGSYFSASPTFQFGFNQPTTMFGSGDFFVCDLGNNTLRKQRTVGTPMGWWDEQRLILKAKNNDLLLYDVVKQTQEPFIPFSKFQVFYTDSGLTNDPSRASFFSMSHGRENEFYFTDDNNRWRAKPSFLGKIVRPGATLKMIDLNFKFEWSDHFNANENYYLYTGREMGYTNSAVYLRDLKANRLMELVPPDPDHTNAFSIPRFYGDSVIYLRSNKLWRVDLDGSHNRRLFPPDAQHGAGTN